MGSFIHIPSQVDIRFPQPGSDDPDRVTVTGLPENVDNAIDHLLNLEEEYVSVQGQGASLPVLSDGVLEPVKMAQPVNVSRRGLCLHR